ncbi:MAG: NifU family protein [Evtepia sp.]
MSEQIERALDAEVRPYLKEHGGNVSFVSFENGVLRLRMEGQCATCPSAALTNETVIQEKMCAAIPEIQEVLLVQETSETLLSEARRRMTHSFGKGR